MLLQNGRQYRARYLGGGDSVTKSKDDVFIIRVQGDSMINIGIDNDDMLLVKDTGEFKSGDIVVAETNEGTTIKRFVIEDGRVYFQPENASLGAFFNLKDL